MYAFLIMLMFCTVSDIGKVLLSQLLRAVSGSQRVAVRQVRLQLGRLGQRENKFFLDVIL